MVNRFTRQTAAAFFIFAFVLSGLVQARPMLRPSGDEANAIPSLPPVNWIRSRTIDVKHLAIDLQFDWDKEQAIGSTTVTLAPFTDTDRFTLDAAAMTIDSRVAGRRQAA